jgi:dihydroorotate dehydrogenase electron transfer subunit
VLRPVCALARRYSLPVQALVADPAMTCGTGLCAGCVLPVVGKDGVTRMVRACVAGPVFRGDVVRWDDVGTIPFDAFGAPGWKPRGESAASPGDGASGSTSGTRRAGPGEGRSHAG